MSPDPTHQLDRLPSIRAPACDPFPARTGAGRSPRSALLTGAPHAVFRALGLFSCSDSTGLGPELGGFPGLLPHRLFRLPFFWGCQFSGFPGWLCFYNLSPWSRLRRLPLSLGQEEVEGPGSLGQALEPVDFQEQSLGSPQPHQPASLQTGPVNYYKDAISFRLSSKITPCAVIRCLPVTGWAGPLAGPSFTPHSPHSLPILEG